MDTIKSLKTRRSIRKFLSKPVEKEIIEDIIDCGRLAPTANNVQPWEFIVVTDSEIRKKIADITDYGKFISSAPVCIVIFSKDTKYYLENGSAATENILLAANSYGLGSCWVAGDKKRYADDIRKLLNVPEGYRLVSLIPVGYSDEKRSLVPTESTSVHKEPTLAKRGLKDVIHREKW